MVIISGGTRVIGFEGVVSANWDLNPSIQRLWQLGSWLPYDTLKQAQQNVSVTVYAGGGPSIDLQPADSCIDSDAAFDVIIIPAGCGDEVSGPSGKFYLTSYNYSKGDTRGYGQQTYAGTQWIAGEGFDAPTVVLQGISEGQYNGDLTTGEMGVVANTPEAEGYTGSVSAGSPGIGSADTTYFVIFTQVGTAGAILRKDGYIGNASASIPHTPLWLPV